LKNITKNILAVSTLVLALILMSGVTIIPAKDETGQGEDIFRIIMTIFGVDKSRGDVVAMNI
jgi:hypothetical protein